MTEGATRITVSVPYGLREFTRGEDLVEVEAETLGQAIAILASRFPGLGYRILDDQGRLRRYVNAYVNDDPVSHMIPESVRLRSGDTVTILPSVAGG